MFKHTYRDHAETHAESKDSPGVCHKPDQGDFLVSSESKDSYKILGFYLVLQHMSTKGLVYFLQIAWAKLKHVVFIYF
jgi:hypothetical protein